LRINDAVAKKELLTNGSTTENPIVAAQYCKASMFLAADKKKY